MNDTTPTTPTAEVTYSLLFTIGEPLGDAPRATGGGDDAVRAIEQLDGVLAELRDEGVQVRGLYDLTGFDGYAQLMVWLRSPSMTDLQWGKRQLCRTLLLQEHTVDESIPVVELTELDAEPRRWLNFIEAAEVGEDEFAEFADDDFDMLEDEQAPELIAEADELDAADPELGIDADAAAIRGDAMVSLHAHLGIGQMMFVVIAEADQPVALLGELGAPFGDDVNFDLVTSRFIGRLITPAEAYEVLH